jgi:hypothetical protein
MGEKAPPKPEQSDAPKFEFNDKLNLNSGFSSGNYILKELPDTEDPALYHFHPPGDPLKSLLHNLTLGNHPRICSIVVAFYDMEHEETLEYFAKHEPLQGWAGLLKSSYTLLFYV